MSSIIERVRSIIDVYNSSVSGFEKKCGVSNGTISQPLKGNKEFSSATISKICYYTPFDSLWLERGTGEPFKPSISFIDHMIKVLFEEGSDIKTFERLNGNIPGTFKRVIDNSGKMRRGSLILWAEDLRGIYPNHDYSWIYENPDGEEMNSDANQQGRKPTNKKHENSTINLLGISGDFAVKISDNALSPNINFGDIAICRVTDISRAINWNALYFIQTKDISIIRRIKSDEDQNNIRCVLLNNESEPIIIPREEITKAAIVISVMREIPLP